MYGGDYNPEQWPSHVRDEDVDLMRRAGITAVTVGVFSWSSLQPRPRVYDFAWLDETMDRMAGAGIGVVLATPTASPPPWFSRAHPEALTVEADGTRLSHGSRDTYCASAPAYRAAARDIAAALAARYAGHPALKLWHVHNEYGTGCHCDLAAAAFRRWLQQRHGTLDALNDAWTTAFWGQRYGDWEEILPPRATRYLPNPGQLLDFRRFTSDELLAAYVEQRDVLRAANPAIPVTTNFVLGGWVPVDHARWAREVDVVAIDHYPADAGPGAEHEAAFAADLARGWAGADKDWLLMETAPNLIYTPGRMHAKEPGRMARQALAAIARGSGGAMYFQWRAPRGGAERFHSALVPHAGPDSRVFREAAALGARLREIAPVAAGRVSAETAVVYDELSAYAVRGPGMPRGGLDAEDEARRAHRELWRRGVTADVIGDLRVLTAYRMMVLPMHHLVSTAQAERLTAWVAAGGRLVVTFLSGVADECGRVDLGILAGLLGVRVEEFHPLPGGETVPLDDGRTGDLWRETLHATGADVLARYPDGGPAITRHAVGAGAAWYVSTRLTDGYGALLAEVAAEAGVQPVTPHLPAGVEAVRRGDRLWLLNHTEEAHEVAGVRVAAGEVVINAVKSTQD